MATKKDNRNEAIELIQELGLDIKVPALGDEKSKYWAELVSDLKAKKRDAKRETLADGDVDSDDEVEEVEEPAETVESVKYVVKDGCSMTSLVGVLEGGHAVEPGILNLDAEVAQRAFDNLVKKGYIIKKA